MRVLLGVGGSDDSLLALERGLERARAAGDDLTIAVLDNPRSDMTSSELMDRVEAVVSDTEYNVTIRRVEGDAGSRLVRIAEQEGFDRIVLGGGETSPMGKINIGSIAEFVLLNSRVSVTLIR